MSEPKRFDSNDVDTAMCIWEYILEQLREDSSKGDIERRESGVSKWGQAQQDIGTASLRGWVVDQVDIVWNAYKIASGPDGDCYNRCFDWDFVPAFMEAAYDDELELLPEWEDIAEQIGEESRA